MPQARRLPKTQVKLFIKIPFKESLMSLPQNTLAAAEGNEPEPQPRQRDAEGP